MKIQSAQETIRSGGLGEGNTFSIAASAKAFEVLSNSLYQNKILAVIREISCNAADAHKMVGAPLSSIEVHLPSISEPWFAVRDYGPSLSHDAILRLYTTYFLSTKDGDNELIGGFGLGSKAPFAVADQFSITAWRDGWERSYICYKQDGVPHINMVGERESANPTGLEVRVAVRTASVYDWRAEAARYFSWWPEVPTGISATSILTSTPVLASANKINGFPEWAILASDLSVQPRILMGLVPYVLDATSIPNLPQNLKHFASMSGLVLSFQVGDLSISPSRETLSYDPTTCANLITRLTAAYSTAVSTALSKVSAAPTLYDARLALQEVLDSPAASLLGPFPKVLWNGVLVNSRQETDLQLAYPAPVTVVHRHKKSTNKAWATEYKAALIWNHSIKNSKRYSACEYFYAERITAKTYRTIAHYMESLPNLPSSPGFSAYIFTGSTLADVQVTHLKEGLPPVIDVASLPVPGPAPRQSSGGPRVRTTYYSFDSGGRYSLATDPLDPVGGGIYVTFRNGKQAVSGDIVGAIRYELIKPGTRVVGISQKDLAKSSVQKMLASNNWVAYSEPLLLAQVPSDLVRRGVLSERLRSIILHPSYNVSAAERLLAWVRRHPAWFVGTDLEQLISPIQFLPLTQTETGMLAHFGYMLKQLHPEVVLAAEADLGLAIAGASDFLKKHPLLQRIDYGAFRKEDVPALLDYLKRS